jgi:Uma2 family endonuclease
MTKQIYPGVLAHSFSVDDYHRMIDTGIITPDHKVELLDGQIVRMSPIGRFHAACVNRLNHFFSAIGADDLLISVQNPVLLNENSEPEPDLAILKFKKDFYASGHPQPEDILALIEVADSSFEKDQEVKLPLYALAKIPEVWIVDLAKERVFVYQEPLDEGFKKMQSFNGSEKIVTGLPISITAKDILG